MENMEVTRSCGTCHACCVWLGITELRKHAGQACKHLSGKDPEHRCTIYEQRPEACSSYLCFWRTGHFTDEFRPDRCGAIITAYVQGISVMVFDTAKAGDVNTPGSALHTIVSRLLEELPDIPELRVAFLAEKSVMLFKYGRIYVGRLLKPTSYEELNFVASSVPAGGYGFQKIS